MRLTILILLVLITGAVAYCFWGRKTETYRDSKICAGEIRRPVDILAIHLSEPRYLTIHGKTFMGVRGLAPYYLDLPQLNAILFVTEKKNHDTFHIVNLSTKEHIRIDSDGSGFGRAIGSGRKPGDSGTDYIEAVQSNRVTVTMRSIDWKETMVLNLSSRSIERRETLSFDATGQVTNRSVQTDLTPPRR